MYCLPSCRIRTSISSAFESKFQGGSIIAEVRKVRKVRGTVAPGQAGSQGVTRIPLSSGSDLDELEELQEFEDLDELEEDLEELLEEDSGKREEPPVSEADKARLAQLALDQAKRQREIEGMERSAGRKGGVQKVRDPKVELFKSLTLIGITLAIAIIIMYFAYLDYSTDQDSAYDDHSYEQIKDEQAWVFLNGTDVEPVVVFDNLSDAEQGEDAAVEYKDWYRMNGDYAMKIQVGFIPLELNWVYYMVIALLVVTGPNGIARRKKMNRIKRKEEKFPDFIRDLAEFWKGGLSMSVAVDTLSKGDYGALDEDVEFMATQLSWGVAFGEVLRMFLERVHTGLIERAIALIEEANRAGGKISDIMLNVAHDAQEIKLLDRQREGTMKSYIFVTLISFIIYVAIIVVMAYVFIPAVAESTEDLEIEGTAIPITISDLDAPMIALIFFASVLVQAIGGGINAGIMGEGNMGASMWYITLFTLLGAVMFQFTGVVMGLD